ncbi:hypothetical protein ACOT81_37480 [Streptomyces sp. WI04-05B]|uniref:hypothetical protein n=1 Tax=Streptomyces TaxID=1883 RepID=UPI0029AD081B|nr:MULTISPECIES: hypothetical protein [unclassified Streptomyces]MDX2547422.1 hypothetical protein [Streptomyces sp. WI04-05B]MDX2586319.1 hypothetical protein [Streptomyces sp. WI04-05A]
MTHTDPSNSPEPKTDCQDVRDRLEPRRLVQTNAAALDRLNPKAFASLFGDDGELILDSPDDDSADDSATGETGCLAHETYADGDARTRVRAIRCRDSYRRTTRTWRFIRREPTADRTEDRVLTAPTGH